jgi:hypothetical protein
MASGMARAGLRLLSADPHSFPVAFVPLIYGVGRRNLLQATNFIVSIHSIEKQVLDYPTCRCAMWSRH